MEENLSLLDTVPGWKIVLAHYAQDPTPDLSSQQQNAEAVPAEQPPSSVTAKHNCKNEDTNCVHGTDNASEKDNTGNELAEKSSLWNERLTLTLDPDNNERLYEELPVEDISLAHGMLIALGLIDCDVISRDKGLGYRITKLGKNVLANREIMLGLEDHEAAA